MEKKIPIVLISGFLGSGKTTFLNRLLAGGFTEKIGLLVNDFGQVAVDGNLLRAKNPALAGQDGSIYEIAGGSVFCSCLTGTFLLGLKYFVVERPGVLYIETSGMSDPSSMGRLLEESGLDKEYEVVLTACLVDSVKVPKLIKTLEVVKKQIAAATHLIINKIDLVSENALADLIALVKGINPRGEVIKAVRAAFDPALLEWKGKSPVAGEAESCNTPANRPADLLLPQRNVSREELKRFLEETAGKVLRLKGFYEIDGGLYYVSDEGGKVTYELVAEGKDFPRGIAILCDPDREYEIRSRWERTAGLS